MAQDIQGQLMPSTKAVMDLKRHVATLYQQLGNTELKSWYHTLVEAGEFDQLGPILSEMLAAQVQKNEESEVEGVADDVEADFVFGSESQQDEIDQLSDVSTNTKMRALLPPAGEKKSKVEKKNGKNTFK